MSILSQCMEGGGKCLMVVAGGVGLEEGLAVSCLSPHFYPPTHPKAHDSHTDLPSSSNLMPINTRSTTNKTTIIHDVIMDEEIDLACITETWVSREDDINPSLVCPPPPGFRSWQCRLVERLALRDVWLWMDSGGFPRQSDWQFCRSPLLPVI